MRFEFCLTPPPSSPYAHVVCRGCVNAEGGREEGKPRTSPGGLQGAAGARDHPPAWSKSTCSSSGGGGGDGDAGPCLHRLRRSVGQTVRSFVTRLLGFPAGGVTADVTRRPREPRPLASLIGQLSAVIGRWAGERTCGAGRRRWRRSVRCPLCGRSQRRDPAIPDSEARRAKSEGRG